MWRPLEFTDYILKKEESEGGWIISISDFVNIWSRTLKNEDIIEIFKETNPLIEAKFSEKLIKKVSSLFDGKVSSKKLEKSGKQLLFQLESELSGVKFSFKLELKQLGADKIFEDITLPFMLLAANLKIRENKLLDIIKRKDAEISEYKQENGVIKRSHLITKEFSFDEAVKEALEETYSSLSKIRKNPSLVLDVIDPEILETSISNSLDRSDICETKLSKVSEYTLNDAHKSKVSSKNTSHCKKSLQNNIQCIKKPKSRVEVQINSCAKKRKEMNPVQLKL